MKAFEAGLPAGGSFEVQLEGGEPTVHPQFWSFVEHCRAHPRCTLLVICTNGVRLPRDRNALQSWVERCAQPLTIKLSINHHLLEHDDGLLDLACALRDVLDSLGGCRSLVLNVRRRKGTADDDRRVVDAVERAGLRDCANVFFLQRYGFASAESGWEEPFLVGTNFSIINPDGQRFGPDLIGRSEAMRELS